MKLSNFYIIKDNLEKQEVLGKIINIEELPDEDFGIVKNSRNYYSMYHVKSGLYMFEGKSTRECTKILKNIINEDTIKVIKAQKNIDETIKNKWKELDEKLKVNLRFQELREEFEHITNLVVPINPWTKSIDVVKLDDKLKTPNGISILDFINSKYGLRAKQLVEEMVNL